MDTDGRGWITPEAAAAAAADILRPASVTVTVADPTNDDDNNDTVLVDDPCAALRLCCAGDGPPTVPVPVFDDDRWPGSMAVPFADGRRLYGVDAVFRPPPLSLYYRLAVGCTAAAPERFRRDVRRWLDAAVAPLLGRSRRRWYPALAGASLVVRAAAAAAAGNTIASTDESADRRVRRKTDPEPDEWPTCDDGPDGRLPNTNVFLLVVLLSLTFTWFCLGVLSVHKMIRHVIPC